MRFAGAAAEFCASQPLCIGYGNVAAAANPRSTVAEMSYPDRFRMRLGDSHVVAVTPGPGPGAPMRRGALLSLVIFISAAFFVLTHFVNSAYQKQRASLAAQWLHAGDADAAAGRGEAAVDAYRAALDYDASNPEITLKLAEALARAGQERQASSYLLSLLQEEPGNGPVNLALARLSARQQDATAAMRYYHGAIYGGWSGQGQVMRREARLELIDFLLARNALTDARSELIGLTGDLPREPGVIAAVADRFARAGDDANALRLYRDAIALHGGTAAVLSGAGMAAFRLADYRAAAEYMERARAAGAAGTVSSALETARAVLDLDPFERRLPSQRRIERLQRMLDIASARVAACQPPALPSAIAPGAASVVQQLGLLQQIAVARRQLTRARELDPDLTDALMKLVLEAEQSQPQCSAASPQDAAVALIARAHEVER